MFFSHFVLTEQKMVNHMKKELSFVFYRKEKIGRMLRLGLDWLQAGFRLGLELASGWFLNWIWNLFTGWV